MQRGEIGSAPGSVDDRAGGAARNLPVPADFNDSELDYLMERAVLPLMAAFAPEAVVLQCGADALAEDPQSRLALRSEEHTSELQSLMRISYAVFCLKHKSTNTQHESIYYAHTTSNRHQ